jgi:uncharacterized protein involved in exopolysaccharide biosynthesis
MSTRPAIESGGAAGSGTPEAAPGELQFEASRLLDAGKILHKHRWSSLSAFSVVVLGAFLHSATATPIFESRVKLLIETEAPNVVSFKEVIEESQARSDYHQTQYNILQSRSLARRTLDALNLWDEPAPRAAGWPAGLWSVVGGVGGTIARGPRRSTGFSLG